MACGRCLEPFALPVDATFDLRYRPARSERGEGEREIAEEDLATASTGTRRSTSTDLLREQFLLALPMKPLCEEACRGLCPDCGANLNRAACDCAPKWEDPRLAALKGLLNRSEGELVNAQSKTSALEDADRQAPHARCAEAGSDRHVPAVSGIEGPAPGLPALRLLQGTPGQGRRRRVVDSRWSLVVAAVAGRDSRRLSTATSDERLTLNTRLRIAIDAMGGDEAPGEHRRAARWSRPGISRSGCCWSAIAARVERELSRHPGVGSLDVELARCAGADRHGRERRDGAAAQAAGVDPRRRRSGSRRQGGGALQRRSHRRVGHGCARARSACLPGVDRPALATIDPDPAASGRAARLRRHRRVPSAASASSLP